MSAINVEAAIGDLIAAGGALGRMSWFPATSGNLSRRLGDQSMAITVSGCDKSVLTQADIVVSGIAEPFHARASAETGLHAAVYRVRRRVGAVLHGHTVAATLVSRAHEKAGALRLRGYEILKAFEGISTHEAELIVPVLPNSQDISLLAAQAAEKLAPLDLTHAFLIAGHGAYVWGSDMAAACRHAEALEFLLVCELERLRSST